MAGEEVDAVRIDDERPRPVDDFRDDLGDRQGDTAATAARLQLRSRSPLARRKTRTRAATKRASEALM
jgi:hypothetical protein